MTNQIIEQIRARSPQGLNTNIIVIGAPRTGKSYCALRVGEVLSNRFSVKNIAWTIPQFSAILEDNNLKPGDVVIFDEVGVGAKARHWYEDNNSRFIDLMQTYGYRGLIAIMTTPSLDYVDSGARKLFHYLIETTPKHNFKEGWVKTKIRSIKYNPKNGKIYYPALVFKGRKKVFTKITVPSDKIAKEYKKVSELWKDNLSSDINTAMINDEIQKYSIEQFAQKVLEQKAKFVKTSRFKGKLMVKEELIKEHFNISMPKARAVKDLVERELNSLPHA